MGLFDIIKNSGDPLKSTAAWGAMVFKKMSSKNWEFARKNKKDIFLAMVASRSGTPYEVVEMINNGEVNSLHELCTSILLSEAISVNPADIPDTLANMRSLLLERGIPQDLA